jgi:hypothetical protein
MLRDWLSISKFFFFGCILRVSLDTFIVDFETILNAQTLVRYIQENATTNSIAKMLFVIFIRYVHKYI